MKQLEHKIIQMILSEKNLNRGNTLKIKTHKTF